MHRECLCHACALCFKLGVRRRCEWLQNPMTSFKYVLPDKLRVMDCRGFMPRATYDMVTVKKDGVVQISYDYDEPTNYEQVNLNFY